MLTILLAILVFTIIRFGYLGFNVVNLEDDNYKIIRGILFDSLYTDFHQFIPTCKYSIFPFMIETD